MEFAEIVHVALNLTELLHVVELNLTEIVHVALSLTEIFTTDF